MWVSGLGFDEAGNGFDGGAGAGVDEDAVGAEGAGTASVEGDFNGLLCDEAAEAHDDLGVALGEVGEVDLHVVVDQLLAAGVDAGHIDVPVAVDDAELGAALEVLSDFGAVDDVLAGKAGDVGTGSADALVLDGDDALSLRAEGPRHVFACFSAADDDCVVLFRGGGHEYLRSVEY